MSEEKRGRGRPKKSQWADLPEEFQNAVQSMNEQEIRNLVSKTALAEEENKKLMKEDQHLKECRFTASEAAKGYKDATKMNVLKIRFLKDILECRGKPTT
jgi:hypothetical protein